VTHYDISSATVILDINSLNILTVKTVNRVKLPNCVTVPNLVAIGQTVAEIWQFFDFQNGGHPPSWIL